MSKNHYADSINLPQCCKKCKHLDSDSKDEYSPPVYFCLKNLFMPTVKQTCKKKEIEHES